MREPGEGFAFEREPVSPPVVYGDRLALAAAY